MEDKTKINTLSQVINSMEDATLKLEKAYQKRNMAEFEHAKKIILEFQERIGEELK